MKMGDFHQKGAIFMKFHLFGVKVMKCASQNKKAIFYALKRKLELFF